MQARERIAHFRELGRLTTDDLLCAELTQLGLEVDKLLFEILLILAPKGACLDLRRLQKSWSAGDLIVILRADTNHGS